MKLYVITEDEEDNKILECALTSGADVIVSGDKHLQKLGQFRNKIIIFAPRGILVEDIKSN